MEHVREDPEFQRAAEMLNDLSAKMALVDAEIAEAESRLIAETSANDRTTVDALLELVPGRADPDSLEAVRQRHITLKAQRERLRTAINEQHIRIDQVHRATSRRLVRAAGRDYLKKAEVLQGFVERVLATNAELAEMERALYARGAVEFPIARFPTRPEQVDCMPQWKQNLDDLITALKQFMA